MIGEPLANYEKKVHQVTVLVTILRTRKENCAIKTLTAYFSRPWKQKS